MHHDCPVALQMLYTRARICETFPAYKLSELQVEPAGELLQALHLLALARKVQS